MQKEDVIRRMRDGGLVAVIRADSTHAAIEMSEACLEGGAVAVEITFTTPGAHHAIAELRRRHDADTLLVGAGTVLDPETARIAIIEGANYIVSPALCPDTARLCNRYRIAYMPGAMTIREIISCLEAGADIIKIFPGEVLGPGFLRAAKAPLPQAELMPTGGVDLENVKDWIAAGATALGVGGGLTRGCANGDMKAISDNVRAFVRAIRSAREAQ